MTMIWDEGRGQWKPVPRKPLSEEQLEKKRAYMREYQRARRLADHDKSQSVNRAANLKNNYGLTPEEYDKMRVDQDFRCGICGIHEDELPIRIAGRPRLDGSRAVAYPLVVDHCHASNHVRKLLCPKCNHLLGTANDDIRILSAAIKYLETFQLTTAQQWL